MEGILILDKPPRITSHDACDKVKKILKLKKAGHAGTLDPAVTGVLLIALENSTKALRFFNKLNKEYIGRAHLHAEIDKEKLLEVSKKFIGKIIQIPPKRSRVKRVEREREIYEFKILKHEKRNFDFFVSCEAGTYIRKLIDDLGKELGCGAHMTYLRRIKQGPFSESESIKINELKNEEKLRKSLISLEDAIKRLNVKFIEVDENQAKNLKLGRFLKLNSSLKEEEIGVALCKNKIVAIIKKKDNLIKPERII